MLIKSPLLFSAINLHLVVDAGVAMCGAACPNKGRSAQRAEDSNASGNNKGDFQLLCHTVGDAERKGKPWRRTGDGRIGKTLPHSAIRSTEKLATLFVISLHHRKHETNDTQGRQREQRIVISSLLDSCDNLNSPSGVTVGGGSRGCSTVTKPGPTHCTKAAPQIATAIRVNPRC
jgi:hypothetical protein